MWLIPYKLTVELKQSSSSKDAMHTNAQYQKYHKSDGPECHNEHAVEKSTKGTHHTNMVIDYLSSKTPWLAAAHVEGASHHETSYPTENRTGTS